MFAAPNHVDITIVQGDAYLAANGRAIEWTDTAGNWPDLTGATIVVEIAGLPAAGSVVVATGLDPKKKVQLELTSAHTLVLARQNAYLTRAVFPSDNIITLAEGIIMTIRDNKEV